MTEVEAILAHHDGPDHAPQPCCVQHDDGTWSSCDVQTLSVGQGSLLGYNARSFADVWQHRDDMRRDPGYANANVVPVTSDEAAAMQSWAEAILWASDTDSGTWTR